MLVKEECSTTGSASPSLLDSPTLARVERARRRQEQENSPLHQSSCCQSLLATTGREMHAIKKGLLWQQRDRLFSRWKERYFILTRDYLHCFKRAADKISNMGQFIFKECMLASKERRRALRKSHDPRLSNGESCNNNSITSNLEDWLLTRHKIAGLNHLSDSVPDLQHLPPREREPRPVTHRGTGLNYEDDDDDDEIPWLRHRPANYEQRLSLLTDIDVNSYDLTLETPPPSVPATFRGRPTSYRLNSDVFFMPSSATTKEQTDRLRGSAAPSFSSSRSVLTPVGSFRSTHLFNPSKAAAERYSAMNEAPPLLNFRDRSHSDVARLDRPNWKARAEANRHTSYLVNATQV
ncbi:uncharacterized protein [Anabrus simplex]|uniref:uncharacterized protein isoform X2 n=1 Tax=Anabrus simplex TaxID=316456 RepID=UPI0035A3B849